MPKKISRDELERDPILRTYHIPHTDPEKDYLRYDASGYFSPISIKDQIIRVCTILERAKKGGLISEKRPLLIIGGGIAGAVAAIRAAEMGVKTVIVDKGRVLNNIVTLSARFICPTQYDWTAAHWPTGEFAVNSVNNTSKPFVLLAGPLNDRIQALDDLLEEKTALVTKASNTEISSPKNVTYYRQPFLQVTYKTKPKVKPPEIKRFGMALSCTGFGKERVFIENQEYRGVEFWRIFEHSDIILENNPEQKILICGSGDGSLQDYLLMATVSEADTVRNLYEKLKLTDDQQMSLEDAISRAEEAAKRKEIWMNRANREALCRLTRELHQIHLAQVDKLLENTSVKKRIKNFLRKEKSDNSKLVAARISVYFECNHFSTCYPLNRFMALLVSEYLRREEGIETMFGSKFIKSITGYRHECDKNKPSLCIGKKHRVVTLRQESCADTKRTGKKSETFHTVIVRFGLDGKSLIPVFGQRPAFPGTQIIQYKL